MDFESNEYGVMTALHAASYLDWTLANGSLLRCWQEETTFCTRGRNKHRQGLVSGYIPIGTVVATLLILFDKRNPVKWSLQNTLICLTRTTISYSNFHHGSTESNETNETNAPLRIRAVGENIFSSCSDLSLLYCMCTTGLLQAL